MKVGDSVVGEITLYEVEIDGRGGDSVHSECFETHDGAVLASAVDGGNHTPYPVNVLKLSDGTYITRPVYIQVSLPPTRAEVRELARHLPPAARTLLRRKGVTL